MGNVVVIAVAFQQPPQGHQRCRTGVIQRGFYVQPLQRRHCRRGQMPAGDRTSFHQSALRWQFAFQRRCRQHQHVQRVIRPFLDLPVRYLQRRLPHYSRQAVRDEITQVGVVHQLPGQR